MPILMEFESSFHTSSREHLEVQRHFYCYQASFWERELSRWASFNDCPSLQWTFDAKTAVVDYKAVRGYLLSVTFRKPG
jgi:hypothetical protein